MPQCVPIEHGDQLCEVSSVSMRKACPVGRKCAQLARGLARSEGDGYGSRNVGRKQALPCGKACAAGRTGPAEAGPTVPGALAALPMSSAFYQKVIQDEIVQHGIRQQALELSVLPSRRLKPGRLGHLYPTILGLQLVGRGRVRGVTELRFH